jgi:hypothetical protein
MSPERQARAVNTVKSGDAPNIRAVVTSGPRTDEPEPGVPTERTFITATAQLLACLTTAQQWARYLADQMSVPELREVRNAIDKILATAD